MNEQEHIKQLQECLLALSRAYSDWPVQVSDEDEIKINAQIALAEREARQ